METKDTTVRINLATLNKVKRLIKPRQFETLKAYIERVMQEAIR